MVSSVKWNLATMSYLKCTPSSKCEPKYLGSSLSIALMNFLKDSLSLVSNWSLLESSLNTDTSDFFQNGELNQYIQDLLIDLILNWKAVERIVFLNQADKMFKSCEYKIL